MATHRALRRGHPFASMAVCLVGAMPLVAMGHHSFAPHFDSSKPVVITGTITEYEQRNPHAYVHLDVEDENGLTREYVCESHGVTQLSRNGVTPELLSTGAIVTLSGSQARNDPFMCFFNTVELADGRLLSVNGPSDPRPVQSGVIQRQNIYGNWLLAPANRRTSGPQPMMASLTDAGRRAVEAYDPFTDDPTFDCDPVAIRRVWFAPSTPLEISRDGERVVLRYEWMDVERVVHLDATTHPADGPRISLGHSIGSFDGEVLVIETANYSEGVLSQYVEIPGEPTRGLLHSAALTSVERIWFDQASNRLNVSIELSDAVFYGRNFDLVSAQYGPTDLVLEPFNCMPENLDHSLVE